MTLEELEELLSIVLNQLRVSARSIRILKGKACQFLIEDFGVIVCCMDRVDYTQISDVVEEKFKDWRPVYVTGNDNLPAIKDKILWALMKSGYMKWLRYNFPRQVKSLLAGTENLGQKIIEERIRIWANKPKYRFFIEDNMVALRNGILRELTNDPSFFDYMPEED
jgi:hypothetical protein